MMGVLLVGLYVFVLAIFVGFEIITKVPPTLHTPLMSGAERDLRHHDRSARSGGACRRATRRRPRSSASSRSSSPRSTWSAASWSPTACSRMFGRRKDKAMNECTAAVHPAASTCCRAVLFILGLKGLTKVRSARRGNAIASLAMLLAVVATLLRPRAHRLPGGSCSASAWSAAPSGPSPHSRCR